MDYESILERFFEYQNKKKSEDLRQRRPNIKKSTQLQIDLINFRNSFSAMIGVVLQDKNIHDINQNDENFKYFDQIFPMMLTTNPEKSFLQKVI